MSSNGAATSPESKLSQYVKAPYRALRHARNLYESTMAGAVVGKTPRRGLGPIISLPRGGAPAFGCAGVGADEDLDELIRAACRSKMRSMPVKASPATVSKSRSVATMRIDEDRPCCFEEEEEEMIKLAALGPRCRSYDAAAKGKMAFF
ncbi:hypothetical protein ZIOFF_036307 [Zingiber officinale]|uniref:Uncharacterized protein n=1 Tax=Zingiber officinale TaxID=94328 RepID=A0A8J5GMT5_ZINOF|nr:hypothetical protein ZIOFF_036307 [Zingiber officinale]